MAYVNREETHHNCWIIRKGHTIHHGYMTWHIPFDKRIHIGPSFHFVESVNFAIFSYTENLVVFYQFFDSLICFGLSYTLFCRQWYNWFSRNRFWEDRSICSSSSSEATWKSAEIVCPYSNTNKVWLFVFLKSSLFSYFICSGKLTSLLKFSICEVMEREFLKIVHCFHICFNQW